MIGCGVNVPACVPYVHVHKIFSVCAWYMSVIHDCAPDY